MGRCVMTSKTALNLVLKDTYILDRNNSYNIDNKKTRILKQIETKYFIWIKRYDQKMENMFRAAHAHL